LRDPRRSSFDPETGDLWIGDVGQDRFEEVIRFPAGEAGLNFGWSDMEGEACHNLPDCDPAAYELPVHTYDQVTPQCGVVGGYVYRGRAIPALDGVYLFSDFCSGFIWGLDTRAVAAGEPAVAYQLFDAPQGFVSFGEDDDGELYAVALDGSIYRLGAEQA
jgi:glucose/arabinose dehydrogenase